MDLKDKLLGDKTEEKEFPDDFEPTDEAKKVIEDHDDSDIDAFLKKKKVEKEETKKEEVKPAPPEIVQEAPVEKPVEKTVEKPEEPVNLEESEQQMPVSELQNILNLYIDKNNVEKAKETIDQAIKGKYSVSMQAGIKIDAKNFEKLKPMMDFFVKNGFLVTVVGEKFETVF